MQLEVRGVFVRATGNPTDLRHAALREHLSNLLEVVLQSPSQGSWMRCRMLHLLYGGPALKADHFLFLLKTREDHPNEGSVMSFLQNIGTVGLQKHGISI